MKKITFLAALLMSGVSFAQIVASTSFQEEVITAGVNDAKYFDLGDANVAHDLVNNPLQTPLNQNGVVELGVDARYEPYDTPDVGLTDGDFIGITSFTPSADVGYTDGDQGYQITDVDGNFILEFATVDLTGVTGATVSIDYLFGINSNPLNGNFEGDGTENASSSDRFRIYVKDLTNNTEIDIVDSTGSDIDDLVPFDATSGEYQLEWITGTAALTTGSTVQLVVEARCNAGGEAFFLDNVIFDGILGTNDVQNDQFAIYPNPATKGFVNISSTVAGAKQVAVYDVLGKEVINTTIANDRLNIADLNSGIYIVKIVQGTASITKKLVVN